MAPDVFAALARREPAAFPIIASQPRPIDAAKLMELHAGRRYACRHRAALSSIPTPFAANSGPWVSDDPHVSSRLSPALAGLFLWALPGFARWMLFPPPVIKILDRKIAKNGVRVLLDDPLCHRHGIRRRPRREPTGIVVAASEVVMDASHLKTASKSRLRDAPRTR